MKQGQKKLIQNKLDQLDKTKRSLDLLGDILKRTGSADFSKDINNIYNSIEDLQFEINMSVLNDDEF